MNNPKKSNFNPISFTVYFSLLRFLERISFLAFYILKRVSFLKKYFTSTNADAIHVQILKRQFIAWQDTFLCLRIKVLKFTKNDTRWNRHQCKKSRIWSTEPIFVKILIFEWRVCTNLSLKEFNKRSQVKTQTKLIFEPLYLAMPNNILIWWIFN